MQFFALDNKTGHIPPVLSPEIATRPVFYWPVEDGKSSRQTLDGTLKISTPDLELLVVDPNNLSRQRKLEPLNRLHNRGGHRQTAGEKKRDSQRSVRHCGPLAAVSNAFPIHRPAIRLDFLPHSCQPSSRKKFSTRPPTSLR